MSHLAFINTGIHDLPFRELVARLLAEIPELQETDPRHGESDVALFLDELAERHPEEIALALRRAGHRVRLSDDD